MSYDRRPANGGAKIGLYISINNMPNAERGNETNLEELKQRRLALLAEFKTMWEACDDRVINGLVALPRNELSERMNAMRKAVIKSVPVTSLTRGYAGPHEIEAGARHKHDANPVLRGFFLGLA